jgi:uncharacterized protein (TIGR02594 family)
MKWLGVAFAEVGVSEYLEVGKSNPRIELYQKTTQRGSMINDDVPWCSSFVNWVLKSSGINGTGSAWARSFLNWGKPLKEYQYGCIVVFSRGKNMGHVGFAVGKKVGFIKVLGGNQDNKVCEKWYPSWRVLGYRWDDTMEKIKNSVVA